MVMAKTNNHAFVSEADTGPSRPRTMLMRHALVEQAEGKGADQDGRDGDRGRKCPLAVKFR